MSVKCIIKLSILALFISSSDLLAKEITVCVIDSNRKDNPKYYHLPNTASILVCELDKNSGLQTLRTLYSQGWSLIQILKVDSRYTNSVKVAPSPVLYFER